MILRAFSVWLLMAVRFNSWSPGPTTLSLSHEDHIAAAGLVAAWLPLTTLFICFNDGLFSILTVMKMDVPTKFYKQYRDILALASLFCSFVFTVVKRTGLQCLFVLYLLFQT